ncbi:hypothetical protein DPMN_192198 [Dreissena polymorpha]|uniref:Uncharacterized protein n=2 Tax=Dreissena polymorpha TaxID=45954 RepID=A0A9D3XYM7_DREPO|nr:hypothetical protein DPMN_192198 [Dreissena polymorpha]
MAAICYRRKGQKTFNDSEVHPPVELPAISNSTYEMFEDMSGKRPANNNKFPALGAQIQRLLGKNNTTSPSVSNLGCVSENFGSSDVDVNYITPINSNMYDSIDGDQETSVAPIGLVHNSAPSSNTAKSPSIFFREPGTIHPNIETHREYHNVDLPVSQVRTTNSLMIPSTSDGYEAVGYEGNIYTDPDNLVF